MILLKVNSDLAQLHFNRLEQKLYRRINKVLKEGCSLNNNVPTDSAKDFLEDLLLNDNLRVLIVASPEELRLIATKYLRSFPDLKQQDSGLALFCRNIFVKNAYERYLDKRAFILDIDFGTCPYCNRAYITSLDKKGKIKPQIDHFFPKSIYPFFAVSYFNLIPVCTTCNGFEGKTDFDPLNTDLINPYAGRHDDFEFDYRPLNGKFTSLTLSGKNLEIVLKTKNTSNLSVFKLKELYDTHSDHVSELIFKSKIKYSTKYREHLKKISQIKLTDKEIDRLIIGNYTSLDEFHKRPLAKLYYDIGKKLGLIQE